MVLIQSSTNKFARTFAKAASVSRKTGCWRMRLSRMFVEGDVTDLTQPGAELKALDALGLEALRDGEVAVVSLAAGAGSRWTQGAGVVKALHPFAKLAGRHRTFLEAHLAKSRRISRRADAPVPHVFTTSYLTHEPTAAFLEKRDHYGYEGLVLLSPGRSVGLRLVPTVRDLRFLWEEMPQQMLDEQQQKVRESLRAASLVGRARRASQRLHRQPSAAMPAPRGGIGSRCRIFSATARWRVFSPNVHN
jgi:hypothetical protein